MSHLHCSRFEWVSLLQMHATISSFYFLMVSDIWYRQLACCSKAVPSNIFIYDGGSVHLRVRKFQNSLNFTKNRPDPGLRRNVHRFFCTVFVCTQRFLVEKWRIICSVFIVLYCPELMAPHQYSLGTKLSTKSRGKQEFFRNFTTEKLIDKN